MTRRLLLPCATFLFGWALARAEERPRIMPPEPPRHGQRVLDTAASLAGDLAETVAYLEAGQSYFRAFKRSSHTKEENAAMLRFLESYERERETAKRELPVLSQWIRERSDLESTEEKLDAQKKR